MPEFNIDISALQADVNKLSNEDVQKMLLDLRVKQRVAQKKYHSDDKAKEYRAKKAEFNKLLAKRAKELGIYDKILEQAGELADAKLGESEAEAAEPVEA